MGRLEEDLKSSISGFSSPNSLLLTMCPHNTGLQKSMIFEAKVLLASPLLPFNRGRGLAAFS